MNQLFLICYAFSGQLSCSDEDRGQTIKYTLTDDDKGGFRVSQNKYIVTGRVFDHEVSSLRGITVKATDNGLPAMSVSAAELLLFICLQPYPVD